MIATKTSPYRAIRVMSRAHLRPRDPEPTRPAGAPTEAGRPAAGSWAPENAHPWPSAWFESPWER